MRLEDCTKEELIYLLRERALYDSKHVETDVLLFRSDRCVRNEAKYNEEASRALDLYTTLIKPYAGRPVSEVPDRVWRKAREAFNAYKMYSRKGECESNRWDKLQKRLDELL